MKRFILVFFLLSSHFIFSQNVSDVHVTLGLRSHFGGMQSFSDVLGHYNDNREWLDNNFSTSSYMGGFELGLEKNFKNWGLSMFRIYRVGTKRVSKGITPNGDEFKRKINASIWGFELADVWYTPIHIGNWNFGGGIMPVGTGKLRIYNKLNDAKKENIYIFRNPSFDWLGRLVNQRHYYANLHLDVSGDGVLGGGDLHFQLFYTLGPKREYELHYFNQELNPTTYNEIYKRTLQQINNFGIKVLYGF